MTNFERIKYLTIVVLFGIIIVSGTVIMFNEIGKAIPHIVDFYMGR